MPPVRRSDPAGPGWTRRRRGRGFELFDARGRKLTGEAARERVAALAIPPAWNDVWICPSPDGHIQATGIDAAGRRQYLYNERWTASRSRAKFARMGDFAVRLPELRAAAARDFTAGGRDRTTVLAALTQLLDIGFFRVGSERYAAENRTFGLTTLLREHVAIEGHSTIVFDYIAKHRQRRIQRVAAPELAELVDGLRRRRRDPGPHLFASCDEELWRRVRASDLNAYLQGRGGGAQITAKDFRTWNATVAAAALLAATPVPGTKTARARAATGVLRHVAQLLGNTLAVCRSSYVDPRVVDRWAKGDSIDLRGGSLAPDFDTWSGAERGEVEQAVIDLLGFTRVG